MKRELLVPRMRPVAVDDEIPGRPMRTEIHPSVMPSTVHRDRSGVQLKAMMIGAGAFVLIALIGIVAALGFAVAAMNQSQDVAMHALDTAAAIAESAAEVAEANEREAAASVARPWWSIPFEAVVFIGILIVAGIAAARGAF